MKEVEGKSLKYAQALLLGQHLLVNKTGISSVHCGIWLLWKNECFQHEFVVPACRVFVPVCKNAGELLCVNNSHVSNLLRILVRKFPNSALIPVTPAYSGNNGESKCCL